MKVIAVSGQLGNGKDEFSDVLAEYLNSRKTLGIWERSAFATAVKQVYMDAFGVDMDYIEKWKRVDDPPPGKLKNVRKSLQFIGDGFRQIQADIWIDIALRDESKQLILSDERYINEAKAVKKKGGMNFLVWRPGWENDDPNPSEAQVLTIVRACLETQKEGKIRPELCPGVPDLQYYDYFFKNDGDLRSLFNKVETHVVSAVEQYFGGV